MTRRTLYPLSIWLPAVLIVPLVLISAGFIAVATTRRDELVFDHPQLWWLAAVGPVAAGAYLWSIRQKRSALERFTSGTLAPLLAPQVHAARQASRASLFVMALLLIAAGIIGPRWGTYLDKQKVQGVDIVVAIDVSRSMYARDVIPDRITLTKQMIRQQLTERPVFGHTNRMALLAFAGSTSLRMPLTTDHLAFRTKLDQVQVGSVPRGGTAISQAITAATDLFAHSPEDATKVILLFTDGEDHEGDPVAAAQTAFQEHGIRTFAIGVGDPARTAGAEVPSGPGENARPLLYDGQIVFSKLDLAGLQAISRAGGGQFASLRDLPVLVDAIAGMRRTHLGMEERIRHMPRYQWFVSAAILLLYLEQFIHEHRTASSKTPLRAWQQENK